MNKMTKLIVLAQPTTTELSPNADTIAANVKQKIKGNVIDVSNGLQYLSLMGYKIPEPLIGFAEQKKIDVQPHFMAMQYYNSVWSRACDLSKSLRQLILQRAAVIEGKYSESTRIRTIGDALNTLRSYVSSKKLDIQVPENLWQVSQAKQVFDTLISLLLNERRRVHADLVVTE